LPVGSFKAVVESISVHPKTVGYQWYSTLEALPGYHSNATFDPAFVVANVPDTDIYLKFKNAS
jgi:hypothetical protein